MSRNSAIDLAKYIASVFVIAIHTHPFQDIGSFADFVSVGLLCRWAVPFFAICTGFYLAKAFGTQQKTKPVWKSLRKVVVMYLGWSFFYLLIHLADWYATDTLCGEYVFGWFKSLIVSTSYFHLWYLTALIYALPFFAFLIRFVPIKYFVPAALCLWAIQVISYAYASYLPFGMIDIEATAFDALFTGVTRLLPLMMMGAWLSQIDLTKCGISKLAILFIIFFLLMVVEIAFIRNHGGERWSFIFTTLPMSVALFAVINSMGGVKLTYAHVLARMSMIVYCLHPALIWLLKDYINHSLILFLTIAVVSTLLSFIWVKVKT